MATYLITAPDGTKLKITAPDDATPEQVLAYAKENHKPAAAQAPDPTEGMSGTDKFLAGVGKAFADTGMGIGQMLGLVSRDDVAERRRLDAPLMKHTAATVGNVAGNVAIAVPTVLLPGAATVPGAAAIGAAQGLIQPSTSSTETAQNVALGGGLGAGSIMAGRAVAGLYSGAKALLDPFSQAGREKIAGRMIERFADNPSVVAGARGGPSITGAVPTLAEQTGDAGMARLQDAIRSVDPQIAGRIDARLAGNNAARVNQLQNLAGTDGARDFALQMRNGTAKDLYERAFSVPIEMENLSAAQRGEVTKLLNMPAVQDALKVARENAANFGMKFQGEGNIAGLHQAKLAMDDSIAALSGGGANQANKAAAIKAARDRLVTFMENMSPDYKDARMTYADMSKPINQMDVAGELLKRGASVTSDLTDNHRLMPNALLRALQDEKGLIQSATGRKGIGKSLSDVLTPEQEAMVRAVAAEVDRSGAVARAGNGPGSATAQRMASQNVLRQLVGPTGLPSSWAESVLANTVIGKPLNLLYGGIAEPRIQQIMAEAVLNPDVARQTLAASAKPTKNTLNKLLTQSGRVTSSALAASGER